MLLTILLALAHGSCSLQLSAANDNHIHRTLLESRDAFAWSEDGATLVYRSALGWQIKGTFSNESGILLPPLGGLRPVAVSRHGRHVVFRTEGGDYEVYESATERRILRASGHERLYFSQTGRSLVQIDPWRGDVKIYDLKSRRAFSRFKLFEASPRHAIWGVQYDDDMNRLLVKYTGEETPTWIEPMPDHFIERRAYDPPENLFTNRNAGTLAGERYLATSAASNYARYAVFTRGHGVLGSADFRANLDAYAAVTGVRVGHARLTAKPTAISFSIDERRVAIATESPARILIYKLPRLGKPIRTFDFPEAQHIDHVAYVKDQWVAFSRDAGAIKAF